MRRGVVAIVVALAVVSAACGGGTATTTTALEEWTQVTLPVVEAQARIGPMSSFPAVVAAQDVLSDAVDALARAEAAHPEETSPGQLPEAWQPWWCLRLSRTGMRSAAQASNLVVPETLYFSPWVSWAYEHPADFTSLCGQLIRQSGESVTEEMKDALEAQVEGWIALYSAQATRNERHQVAVAEVSLSVAQQAYATAVANEVPAIVRATYEAQGAARDAAVRAALTDAEWVFCDRNWDTVFDAAVSLDLLPAHPSDDLLTYWWVTRPDEYIRACSVAYELR